MCSGWDSNPSLLTPKSVILGPCHTCLHHAHLNLFFVVYDVLSPSSHHPCEVNITLFDPIATPLWQSLHLTGGTTQFLFVFQKLLRYHVFMSILELAYHRKTRASHRVRILDRDITQKPFCQIIQVNLMCSMCMSSYIDIQVIIT